MLGTPVSPTPTDAKQNRTLGYLVTAVAVLFCCVCMLLGLIFTGPIQNPFETRPLWNVPSSTQVATAPATAEPAPVTAQPTDPPTAASLTPMPSPTPTAMTLSIKPFCVFAGGKWYSRYNDGLQAAGYYDRTELMTTGLPLQAYFADVNMSGVDTIIFNGKTIKIDPTEEIFNDGGGSQLIGCQQADGLWHFYEAERPNLGFSQISYVTCNTTTCIGRENDLGQPGTWEGDPAGATIAYTEVTAQTVSADLQSHWLVIQGLINVPPPSFDHGIITVVWHK